MSVLQKRINKETFRDILARVSSKLAGWKSRNPLSGRLVGRLTLTKSVLASIPIHTMSVIALPQATLEALDKISRSFLWGSTSEKRRQHLISWKRLCVPKTEGGVGIRKSAEMNKALLAKVGWRLLQNKTSLWAQVFRSKYKAGTLPMTSWVKPKSNWFSTWRSICVGIRDAVFKDQSWVIGNGRQTRFWKDRWLVNAPLIDLVDIDIPVERVDDMVHELWGDGIGWLWNRILPYVSERLRLQLGAVVVDNITGASDRLSWGETSGGNFTVTSAYHLLTCDMAPRPNMEKFWSCIWKVVAPERVRVFLWLVAHQAIMSNAERYRRHLSTSSICSVCKGGEETIIHILRDCPAMAGVWRRIIPTGKRQQFFMKSLLEWLFYNLSSANSTWPTLFAMSIWWGWKWRCGNVLGSTGKCRDRVKFLQELAVEVMAANTVHGGPKAVPGREERLISWKFPQPGWMKVNTDGASRGNPGLATAGGVLRDDMGVWRGGFALNIGICSAPLAELWGVYYGLYIAW